MVGSVVGRMNTTEFSVRGMIKHPSGTWKSFSLYHRYQDHYILEYQQQGSTQPDVRQQQLRRWLVGVFEQLGIDLDHDWVLLPVSGDASFRRYFRVRSHNLSWIAVDAPADKEDSTPFVEIARAWEPLEIHAPQVHHADLVLGFMLLSDLGDTLYLDQLDPRDSSTADRLYPQAMKTLTHIQQCKSILGQDLPAYDRAMLMREMELFREWFLGQQLKMALTSYEQHMIDALFDNLIESAHAQPQVCVHRDYHSRNLMIIDDSLPGVIDFQDAVHGPITYDLVSLLRDCYIAWPEADVQRWALNYAEQAQQAGLMEAVSPARFLGWFDRMGMQRHIKVLGIFSRLNIRDGKAGYLADIPCTLNYLYKVSRCYPEYQEFSSWIEQRLIPEMELSGLFDLGLLHADQIGTDESVS